MSKKDKTVVGTILLDIADILKNNNYTEFRKEYDKNMKTIFPKSISKHRDIFFGIFQKKSLSIKPLEKMTGCQNASSKEKISNRGKTKRGICKRSRKKKIKSNHILIVIGSIIDNCVKTIVPVFVCGGTRIISKFNFKSH